MPREFCGAKLRILSFIAKYFQKKLLHKKSLLPGHREVAGGDGAGEVVLRTEQQGTLHAPAARDIAHDHACQSFVLPCGVAQQRQQRRVVGDVVAHCLNKRDAIENEFHIDAVVEADSVAKGTSGHRTCAACGLECRHNRRSF